MPQKHPHALVTDTSKAKSSANGFSKPEEINAENAEQVAIAGSKFLANPPVNPNDFAQSLLRIPKEQPRQQILRSMQQRHGNAYVGNVIRSMQSARADATATTVARNSNKDDEKHEKHKINKQSKTEYSTKTTANSIEGRLSNKSQIGYSKGFSKTHHGKVGSWQAKNTATNDFSADGQFEGNLAGEASLKGINGSLDASARIGIQDTFSNDSSLVSADGTKKVENKFKAQATAGARGDVTAQGELDTTGLNVGLDASAMAGLEGMLEDSVAFSYRGHKIFGLRGIVRGNLGGGVRVGGNVIFKDGSLLISGELGATVGIGGSLGFEVEVNFRELGSLVITAIVDAFKKIGAFILNGFKKVGEFFTKLFGYSKKDNHATKATKHAAHANPIHVEETKSIDEIAKKIGRIPHKLENIKHLSQILLPDTKVAKALQKVSSVSHKLSHQLSDSAHKMKEAGSKKPETKSEADHKMKELKTVKHKVKTEALDANAELKTIAN